ncbi:DUF1178 family protein [Telmatospirillum sp. J64-1]|uniref:DUF1178 family protein n=1 Tax=Telmatospirillum sp. J64-1 TaxID=2502183 RepID=UPI00115F5438|nr:DUF1178 family protein [Telmatospirillum sp. J64-1]
MIVFNLRCGGGHVFEAWFRDGASYEAQAAAGEVSCPSCGNRDVVKAPMAPNVVSSRNAEKARKGEEDKAARAAAEMRKALVELRRQIEEKADNVGDRFADEARRIHYGETDPRAIYGQATPEESRELAEEGVDFVTLPWLPHEN